MEFVNASDFFRAKSDGDIYQSPESEENGQCDCISTSYQLDFKLIASKTALQARSILYPSKTEIVKGVIVTSEPKVKNSSIKATRIHAALRGYDFEGLRKLRITTIKKQGVENDLIELLETLETRKHLLLFFPYKFEFIYSILYKPCIFKAYRLLNVQTLCIFPCFCPYEPKQGKFLFSADYLIQQSCGSTLRFPCSVSVNVHCGTDISVSEKFLHIFRCCTV